MAETKKKVTVSANPIDIDWPSDKYLMTHALRNEIKRVAARLHGDKEKLALVLATLEVGAGHAKARYSKK